jgi:outer membrane protein OmpA-like peptidoglycan-associated protein
VVAAHFIGKNNAQLLLGAVIGSGLGGLIGHTLDDRRCALYKVAQANHLALASATITPAKLGVTASAAATAGQVLGLDVQLRNQDGEFEPGTAELTPEARTYFAQIADQYVPKTLLARLPANATAAQRQAVEHRKVLIVGHADESDAVPGIDLAKLSQERAYAVAEVFKTRGVLADDIEYQGAGDALPIAPGATSQGRADNARVQIVDLPDLETLKVYVAQRTADPADFQIARSAAAAGSATNETPTAPLPQAPPIQAPQEPAMAAQRGSLARGPSVAAYGFDGQPLNADYSVNLGAPEEHSMFSLVATANAAAPVLVGSCLADHPRRSTEIRNLATGQALSIDAALPGLYGQPWEGTQGQSAIALLHVYVPRDAAAPVPSVTVEFYRMEMEGGQRRARLLRVVHDASVNVYRGRDAILYRVFVQSPAQCLDIDVPARAESAHGIVIYPSAGKEFAAHGIYVSKG